MKLRGRFLSFSNTQKNDQIMKVLMVCLGNICRSPMAEGIMRHKTAKFGSLWQIDSAGTMGWHKGNPPDKRAIDTARKNGVDISSQRSRQFQTTDFDYFDAIFVMDASNLQAVLAMADTPEQRQKVSLLLEKGRVEYPNFEVPDPYYDGRFQEVFDLIDKACETIVHDIRNE